MCCRCGLLAVSVDDDGNGFRAHPADGVGLASMRVRVTRVIATRWEHEHQFLGGRGLSRLGGFPVNKPVRLIIADDHTMFLHGLAAALAAGTELTVVGHARDGPSLMLLVERERPDVVLTDLDMPPVDGTSAIFGITGAYPDIPVLVLSMHSGDEQVLGAIRAGACGYLLKGAGRDEIVQAVLVVAAGGTVFGSVVGRRFGGQSRPLLH